MAERPVSLLEWAYGQIRELLITGALQPGQKLVVGQLADSLSISPTPVKEALNRLVAEGFLETLPRRGFMVKQLSAKEVHDIIDCRMMMEVFAARKAVENFPRYPDIQRQMLDVLAELEEIGIHDYVKATRLEQTYHGALIQLTENQRLIDLYAMLFGVGFAFYIYSSSNHPMERHMAAQEEHRKMYDYLYSGDIERLEDALRVHLEKTMELYDAFTSAFNRP